MAVDTSLLIQAGQAYGVPPAILYAIEQSAPLDGSGQQAQQLAQSMGLSTKDMQDPQVQAMVLAQSLKDNFTKYGNWEQAIATYAGGGPESLQATNSPIAGFVTGALAIAAANAEMGLDQMAKADPRHVTGWKEMVADLGNHMDQQAKQGGVITPQMANSFHASAALVTSGMSRTTDYPISKFDANPFDPQFMSQESENFGYQWQGTVEHGNDYGMGQGSTLTAAMSGTLHYNWWAGQNPYIVIDQGPMKGWKIGYGHMSQVTVQDGARVQAGQSIGLSGGAVGSYGAGMSGGPHVEFQLIDPDGKFHDPQPLLEATTGRKGSMGQSTAYGGVMGNAGLDPEDDFVHHQELDKFVGQSKRVGLTPGDYEKYERYARLTNRYQLDNSDIEDFAKTKDMDDPSLMHYIHGKPHPDYPEVPVGDFHKLRESASLHSIPLANRYPTNTEVVRLWKSGADQKEVKAYFLDEYNRSQLQNKNQDPSEPRLQVIPGAGGQVQQRSGRGANAS